MPADKQNVHFFNESGLTLPIDSETVFRITHLISEHEACHFSLLEVVFVDEDKIIRVNNEYLGRGYVTDTISFRYDENDRNNEIEGTIFLCAPRIYEQALEFDQEEKNEFNRIVIHSLLHLVGYEDQSELEKAQMTERENFYLKQLVSF